MLGSISKIRPCGHHHYYKYAHCYNNSDMNRVASTKTKAFFDELDEEGTFYYPLTGLRNLNNYAFSSWKKLKWFKDNLSKVNNNFAHLFSGVSGGVEKIDITLLGKDYSAVPGIQMFGTGGAYTFSKRIFHLNFPNVTTLSSTFGQCTFAKNSEIKIYAPNLKNAIAIFGFEGGGGFQGDNNPWDTSLNMNIEISCKNVINAENFGGGAQLCDLSYPIDEDGNHTFGSGKPEVGRKWTTFPKLSTGVKMFNSAPHGKEYTLAFLKDLPDWSSDTAEHKLTFSCSKDLAGDKDVNLALKKIDINFNNLSELSESVTKDKGWSLTHVWAGQASENEKLIKEVIDLLEFNSITLPSGYKRCEYLQDNGVAWINTNYIPTNTTGAWFIAKQLVHCPGHPLSVGTVFRAPRHLKNVWYENSCSYWNGTSPVNWGYNGDGSAYEGQLNFKNSRSTSIRIRKNDKTSSTALPTLTVSSTRPLYMFANNNNGSKDNQWNGRIYRVKISEGTSIVRDFIPCLDASGKPCMRDVINGVDYYNQGTGADFTYELYNG